MRCAYSLSHLSDLPKRYFWYRKHILPLTPQPKGATRSFVSSLFWPIAIINADFRQIIRYNGLDAYFFVRYLRMMIKVFVPIWILSWAILLPVTTVNTGTPGQDSLTRFTFGNVGTDQQVRYWAHLVCVWVFTSAYPSFCGTSEHEVLIIISSLHPTRYSYGDEALLDHAPAAFD